MFGKAQKIRNLQRLVRVRTAERDEAISGHKAAQADIRDLAAQLTKAEQTRDRIRGLLWNTRNEGLATRRLGRALRACARYRRQAAVDHACFNELAARYWDALGYGPDTLAKLDPSYATEDTP